MGHSLQGLVDNQVHLEEVDSASKHYNSSLEHPHLQVKQLLGNNPLVDCRQASEVVRNNQE